MKQLIKKILPDDLIDLLLIIRDIFGKRIHNHEAYVDAINKCEGVEIGGPSNIFKYKIPVYSNCLSMEFSNFSSKTVWEGRLSGTTKYFKNNRGKQNIAEATELGIFSDQQFDFLLSSNCLEHVANPIKALKEWKRITKNTIILILPLKDNNFDHRRPITSLKHLIEDYQNDVDEHDLTHLDEILSLHDLKLDPLAGSFKDFKNRSLKNFENRCLHHHVFDANLVNEICDHLSMSIIEQTVTKDDWIFLIKVNH